MKQSFRATLEIIGVNPFVHVPTPILEALFLQANKTKGHIPIKGTINGKAYQQTLVRYAGSWRFYINTFMLKDSPNRIGEQVAIEVEYDSSDRSIEMPIKLRMALEQNKEATAVFEGLSPSRQHEIVRYIAKLKSEESVDRNVERAINFLLGKERFVGREKP